MKWMKRFLCLLLLALLTLPSGLAEEGISELIQSGEPLTVEARLVGAIPHIDSNFRLLQGGCVNEDYGWFAIISAENYQYYFMTECRILKMDLDTMEVIGQSEILKLGHANDVTYIPETNEIYVIHVDKRQVSILDADTLEVKGAKKLAAEGYALEYEEVSRRFVAAHGTAGMMFYDHALEKADSFSYSIETTLVSQGICADENYVYHVFWSHENNLEEPDNMIFVFDWEGNQVAAIPIGVNEHEPENITLVGDTFYIAFNDRVERKCAWLYAMKLKKAE